MKQMKPLVSVCLAVVLLPFLGCASAKKKTPELSRLEGKKVALIEIDGESTARKVTEVALINQLVKRGTFILISKQDVAKAKAHPNQDPTLWKEIASRAGAEVAMRAKVLEFSADTHEGYSKERVYDSQLAAERGEDEGMTDRVYKVKSIEGKVVIEIEYEELKSGDHRWGVATKKKKLVRDARKSAIRMPPKLRFLEELTNTAFKEFFDKYQ